MGSLTGPSPSLNPLYDLRALTTYPFMVNALAAGTIVAIMAGVMGWFMVLRRESFAGHSLSLMAFPGATGALLLGLSAAVGYFVFCVASALVIGVSSRDAGRRNRSQQSAVTGTVQALGLGCGLLFLSLYHGVLSSYETLLFGSLLGITHDQVVVLAVVAMATLAVLAVIGRPLLFASVDEGAAAAGGVAVRGLSLAFLVLLGLAVAATAQITGALLVFALLVAPPATAQLLTPRISASVLLSVLIGALVIWLGLAIAYFEDQPVGFTVTIVAFALYLAAWLARASIDHAKRPRRGRDQPVGMG